MKLNKDAALYFRQAKRYLVCPTKQRRLLIQQLRNDLDSFLTANPDADFDDLAAQFNDPKAYAKNTIAALPPKVLKSAMSSFIFAATIILAVTIIVIAGYIAVNKYAETIQGQTEAYRFEIVDGNVIPVSDDTTTIEPCSVEE